MITLQNINKIYQSGESATHALKGINLTINQGEYLAIMGSSGSGKSTLLNIMGGMDTITDGEYFYDDIPVHELKAKELHLFRKNHVSFIFQQFALMNHYTVYENVEIPLLAKGIERKKRKEIIMEILSALGIEEIANKMPVHISGGQQQRCAIARALASDNPLILADEPTGALDKNTGLEIMDIFKEIHKKGKTIVVITHDSNIADLTDRIITLEDGKLIQ